MHDDDSVRLPLPIEFRPEDLYDHCHGGTSYLDGESDSFQKLITYVRSPEALAELITFDGPLVDGVIRVIVVRHGFGEHNKWHSVGSITHRDANLDDIGKIEAEIVGRAFAKAGIIEKLDLAVISPFRRTLETAQHLLAGAIGFEEKDLLQAPKYSSRKASAPQVETFVQPLCAEDTMARADVLQGNLGSTTSQLRQRFPKFDFSPVDEYCKGDGTDEWWRHHHGPHAHESAESFKERGALFRQWLATLPHTKGTRRAIVVSHGGFLRECFGYKHAPNCGFQVYDVLPDASAVRCNSLFCHPRL